MAQDNFHVDITFPANADLSAKQYLFVKLVTGGKVDVCTSATADKPIGVLQNKPTAGQAATVRVFGQTKVVLGGTVAVGDSISQDATSKAATYSQPDTTHYIAGQAIFAGALNDVGMALVDCINVSKSA